MASARRHSRWSQDVGINLTPLLDVIFNLIFFFILATTLRDEKLLNIVLPKDPSVKPAPAEVKPLEIFVTVENEIHFDGRVVSREELEASLKSKKDEMGANFPGVLIKADAAADYQFVYEVFAALISVGIEKVGLSGTAKAETATDSSGGSETAPSP